MIKLKTSQRSFSFSLVQQSLSLSREKGKTKGEHRNYWRFVFLSKRAEDEKKKITYYNEGVSTEEKRVFRNASEKYLMCSMQHVNIFFVYWWFARAKTVRIRRIIAAFVSTLNCTSREIFRCTMCCGTELILLNFQSPQSVISMDFDLHNSYSFIRIRRSLAYSCRSPQQHFPLDSHSF